EMPTEPMGRVRTRPGDPAHTTGKNCSKGPLSIDYIPEKPEVNEVLSPKPDDRGVLSTGYGRLYYFYEVRLLQPSTVENLGTSWQAPVGRQRLRCKPEPGHPGFEECGVDGPGGGTARHRPYGSSRSPRERLLECLPRGSIPRRDGVLGESVSHGGNHGGGPCQRRLHSVRSGDYRDRDPRRPHRDRRRRAPQGGGGA